jgi:hypothetical protein
MRFSPVKIVEGKCASKYCEVISVEKLPDLSDAPLCHYGAALHKSRALSRSATPGFLLVRNFLSFVSSARQWPIVNLSRQLRASSRQSQLDASIPRQDAYKNISAALRILPPVIAYTGER